MNHYNNSELYQPNIQIPGAPGKRFNLLLLYHILLAMLVFIFFPSLFNSFSTSKEITLQQFKKDILSRKAVEKIEVVNNEIAGVYIKKEMVTDSMFKDLFKPAIGTGINPDPHYSINIGSVESFERKLDDAQKDLPASDKIPGSYVKNQTGSGIL